MKALNKNLIIAGGVVFIFLSSMVLWLFFSNRSPIVQASALSTAQQWARLAPYPESMIQKRIKISGGMFTREYVIEFEALPEDIQKWIKTSLGTKDLTPDTSPDGSVHYKIRPGSGAQFAELVVSGDGKTVRIHAYWS